MNSRANKGTTRLTEEQFIELVVRILGNRHGSDVISRMEDYLGDRSTRMGPVDLSRNVLRSWVDRVCRAYGVLPMVFGMDDMLALALGDMSAQTTIERYASIGARPLPTTVVQASAKAQRYQEGAGYSGVLIDWSKRTGRISLRVITPDDLELIYASDDPTEPTIIRHRGTREFEGKTTDVVEVYDLTDLDRPSYRIWKGETNITTAVLGQSYDGDNYKELWSYKDGTPYHRIVVRGHPSEVYERLQQVEASLAVPVRWTAWGSGTDYGSHPGRNVRGLALAGMSSDTEDGGTGYADGFEVIKRWVDTDDQHPGDHWQDAPAFDPLTMARAIGFYETLTLSLIDLPLQLEATGGEPTAREMEALEERITATLPECRRFDGELLRRCAALANRLPEVEGDNLSEGPYNLLYRGEITEALKPAQTREDKPDGGRTDRSGQSGKQDPGEAGDPEGQGG